MVAQRIDVDGIGRRRRSARKVPSRILNRRHVRFDGMAVLHAILVEIRRGARLGQCDSRHVAPDNLRPHCPNSSRSRHAFADHGTLPFRSRLYLLPEGFARVVDGAYQIAIYEPILLGRTRDANSVRSVPQFSKNCPCTDNIVAAEFVVRDCASRRRGARRELARAHTGFTYERPRPSRLRAAPRQPSASPGRVDALAASVSFAKRRSRNCCH